MRASHASFSPSPATAALSRLAARARAIDAAFEQHTLRLDQVDRQARLLEEERTGLRQELDQLSLKRARLDKLAGVASTMMDLVDRPADSLFSLSSSSSSSSDAGQLPLSSSSSSSSSSLSLSVSSSLGDWREAGIYVTVKTEQQVAGSDLATTRPSSPRLESLSFYSSVSSSSSSSSDQDDDDDDDLFAMGASLDQHQRQQRQAAPPAVNFVTRPESPDQARPVSWARVRPDVEIEGIPGLVVVDTERGPAVIYRHLVRLALARHGWTPDEAAVQASDFKWAEHSRHWRPRLLRYVKPRPDLYAELDAATADGPALFRTGGRRGSQSVLYLVALDDVEDLLAFMEHRASTATKRTARASKGYARGGRKRSRQDDEQD